MNDQKSKLPSGDAGMSPREIEESIKRIEDDLYFSSDSIKVRLGKIEEKLEYVATKEDMEGLTVDYWGLYVGSGGITDSFEDLLTNSS